MSQSPSQLLPKSQQSISKPGASSKRKTRSLPFLLKTAMQTIRMLTKVTHLQERSVSETEVEFNIFKMKKAVLKNRNKTMIKKFSKNSKSLMTITHKMILI
jgi:hypothetical protein